VSALVVDTSSWIAYFAGRGSPLIDEALAEGRLFLPVVVGAELLSGNLKRRERADLEDLLSDLPGWGLEKAHWWSVGSLRASLRRQGLSVSTPDAHVAQCALDLSGLLLTEDAIFRRIARITPLRLVPDAT
jgi:tRNA(fMet)-specific endonuclease VapC